LTAKWTAARFAASLPWILNLDVDVIDGLLCGWSDQPAEAGVLSRAMAICLARTNLQRGNDVIVSPLSARWRRVRTRGVEGWCVGWWNVESPVVCDACCDGEDRQ
jgi:hypothetical protein